VRKEAKMRRLLVLLITFLFLVSGITISNEYEKGKRENERVVATIIFRDNNCPLSTLQPVVVITQPEDGAVVTDPHLVVLGYASDDNGMNYWEWEWKWKGGSKTNSSYFETAEYVEFRIDIYGLHEGWNLITVRFKNIYGATGEDCVNVTYNPSNTPPNKPSTPEGPTEGKVKETLHFNTVTTDPDGDSLEYLIDWGDGTNTGWLGPITSGTPFETFHAWDEPGTYEVKAKARDLPYLEESEWSEPLIVTISGNDTEPPVVVKKYPENGSVFTEPNITAWGYITDNVGVVSYGYTHEWEGGATGSSWPLEEPTTNFSFEIPITLHEGWNRIKIEASDAAGNYGYDEETVYYNATGGLEIEAVFQPVQVVWQEYSGIYKENYMETRVSGKEYVAKLPMVEKKNTLLFGYPTKTSYNKIKVKVTNNFNEEIKIKFRFKIFPDDKVVFTSREYSIGAKQTEEKIIDCPDGLPPKPKLPFQWENHGDGRIELEAISPQGTSLSNKVIVHVKIHETRRLGIAYMSLLVVDNNNRPKWGCRSVPQNKAKEHIRNACEFIQGTYPVKEKGQKGFWVGQKVLKYDEVKKNAFLIDIYKVLVKASKWHAFGWIINPHEEDDFPLLKGRIVLLVPNIWPGLFTNEEWAGIMCATIKHTVIVCEDYWVADAHEIGHTFGLYIDYPYDGEEYSRTYDGNKAPGYWVNKREYKGEEVICFMGKSPPRNLKSRWVCADEYKWLLEKRFTMGDPECLMIFGEICRNGSANFEEWYRLPSGIPDIEMNERGEYTIRFLNSHDEIINETGFNISFEVKDANVTLDCAPLAFIVPYPTNTHKIQILHAGDILEERTVSSNPPRVNILYPNGGESFQVGKKYTITWDAADPDGDNLVYSVGYSWDSGKNWTVIATDIKERKYTWNCSYAIPGNECLIGVVASDGVNTGQDISDATFTILSDTTPPTVELVKPRNGLYLNDRKIIPSPFTVIIGGVTIEADADDNIGISNVSFYVDGEFKNSSYISPFTWFWDESIIGRHEIKIVAYDAAGNIAIDEQKVWIFNI